MKMPCSTAGQTPGTRHRSARADAGFAAAICVDAMKNNIIDYSSLITQIVRQSKHCSILAPCSRFVIPLQVSAWRKHEKSRAARHIFENNLSCDPLGRY
jgi:hypothetical protein